MNVTYEELQDHPISMEEATKVYQLLVDAGESWPMSNWRFEVEAHWSQGDDLTELVRALVMNVYRWFEKAQMHDYPHDPRMVECVLDVLAAVKVDPPRRAGDSLGHGGRTR